MNLDISTFPRAFKRLLAIALAGAVSMLGGCAVGGYDNNLGTDVVGNGQAVRLAWAADHPFAQELASRPVELIAEYQEQSFSPQAQSAQRVTQVVAVSRGNTGKARERVFQLPPALASIGQDQVCLFFRLNNRILPVREAGNGQDTARFRYAEWDRMARRNAIDNVAQRGMGRVKVQLDQNQRDLKDIENQFQRQLSGFQRELEAKGVMPGNGLRTSADCPAIHLEQAAREETPYDVVAPDRTRSVAEKVCVHRIRNGVERLGETGMVNLLPVSIKYFRNGRLDLNGMRPQRQKDLARAQKTFSRWWNDVGEESGYRPELGHSNEIIRVVGLARPYQHEAVRLLVNKAPLSGQEQQTVFRALYAELDAYNSCVSDNIGQLDTKRTAWQRRLQAEPGRVQARQEYYQSRCQEIFRIHAQAQRQAEENNRTLEASLDTLQRVDASKPEAPSQLPTGKPLNQQACSL